MSVIRTFGVGANAALLLIDLALGVVVKGTNAEMMLIVVEHIPKDTRFLLHIAVTHQPRHLLA